MVQQVAISALLSFFPVLINSFTGLRAIEPEQLDLMRSLSATRFETYRIVKLPTPRPSSSRDSTWRSSTRCSARSSRNFWARSSGMGVVITQAQAVSDVAGVFAALVILGMLGIVASRDRCAGRARVVHWAHANRNII